MPGGGAHQLLRLPMAAFGARDHFVLPHEFLKQVLAFGTTVLINRHAKILQLIQRNDNFGIQASYRFRSRIAKRGLPALRPQVKHIGQRLYNPYHPLLLEELEIPPGFP